MCGLPGSSAGFCAPLRQTAEPGHKRTVYIIRSLGPKCKRNDKKRPVPNICMSAPGGCLLEGLFLHRGLGGDRVLRGCLTIRHYNGYNGGCQTASRRYTFPPAGRTAGQAPENHTSTRLTCAASTYNPSPFRYWRAFLGGDAAAAGCSPWRYRFSFSVFIICDKSVFCKLHFVQTYKSYLYILNYFGMLYIFELHLYALRGQFLPCFLHGIGREKELAVLRIDLDVACYVTKLLRHDVYRLSCLVELCYASIIQDGKYHNLDFKAQLPIS